MFDPIINKYAAQFGVPALWIQAVIRTESNFNPAAYREEPQISDASYGLMQVLFTTAQGLGYDGPKEGLFDPDTNIFLGTKLLADLQRRFGPDVRRVYSAYNSGSPDRYKTSGQVALNVNRFVANLESVTREFAGAAPAAIALGPAAAAVAVLILSQWGGR